MEPGGGADAQIVYKDESYAVIGACFEVYKEKGHGFVESVYQECLEIELVLRGVPFQAQTPIALSHKGKALTQTYKPDLVCYGKIIVELKAAKELADEHRAQVHNYLKAAGMKLGLLVNFGHHPRLQYERIVR